MTKTSGYHITLKAFIPAPRTNFAAQAKAAQTMDELTTGGVITPAFVELAHVLDVTGRYGSADIPEAPLPDVDPADMEGGDTEDDPGVDTLHDEAPGNLISPRQKRSSSKG